MLRVISKRVAATMIAVLLLGGTAGAMSYSFRVSCASGRSVVQWAIGDVDPGREFLRVATGLRSPNCSVSDYNPALDATLPVERLSDWEAVLQGTGAILGVFLLGRRG